MPRTFSMDIPDFVIASGGQNSNALVANFTYSDAIAIVIASPATLPETVKLQTSFDAGTNWVDVESQDGAGLLSLPGAGKARAYVDLPFYPMLRVRATTAVAAERTFATTVLA